MGAVTISRKVLSLFPPLQYSNGNGTHSLVHTRQILYPWAISPSLFIFWDSISLSCSTWALNSSSALASQVDSDFSPQTFDKDYRHATLCCMAITFLLLLIFFGWSRDKNLSVAEACLDSFRSWVWWSK